jgi:hypothetical protein
MTMSTPEEPRAITSETYPIIVRAQSGLDAMKVALEKETSGRQEAELQINEIRETFGLGTTRTLVEAADDFKTAIGGAEADRAELRRTKAELQRVTEERSQLRVLWDEFVEHHVPRSELDEKFVSKAEHELALQEITAQLKVFSEIANAAQTEPRRASRSAIAAAATKGFQLP